MACVILQTLLFFMHQANSSASSASASRVAVQLQEDLLRVQGNFAQQSKHKIFGGNSKETCRLPQRARSVVQRLVLPLEIGAKLNASAKLMKNLSVIVQKWRVISQKWNVQLHRKSSQKHSGGESGGKLKKTCRLPPQTSGSVVQKKNKSGLNSENGSKCMLHRVVQPLVEPVPLLIPLMQNLNELSLLVHNSSNSKSCSRKIWSVRSEQKRL